MRIAPLELAWAGGIFEGEGCITVARGHHPKLQVQMTDEDTLTRFHAAVGGVGRFSGPFLRGQNKAIWQWAAYRFEDAQAVLAMLWPYLGDRRKRRAAEVFGGYLALDGKRSAYKVAA